MAKKPLKKKRIIIIVCIVLIVLVAGTVAGGVIAYEMIFGMRYEPEAWRQFSPEDFPGLQLERSDFDSDGTTLAGYKYSAARTEEAKGVVVMAHGLGSGGHNAFMPLIDAFASGGYYVFTYDVHGNGESGGKSVEGLPQGLVDLDNAISHAETIEEYTGLPFMLFGHSWGAYSSANVLALHPEIEGAVIVSGFNESENMLLHYGKQYAGPAGGLLMPILELYERMKFGAEYTDLTGVEAMANTDARIMVVHSTDDDTVPVEYGYDIFYEAFGDSERFDFVLYEDRGHAQPFDTDESRAYMAEAEAAYADYIETHGLKSTAENRNAFLSENLDKMQAFRPDPELVESILAMYDECSAQED